MTFITGITDKTSCILTADNMVTFNKPVLNPGMTASGRTLLLNMNDSSYKIFKLDKNLSILTLSGSFEKGINIVEEINSMGLKTYEDYEKFLTGKQALKRNVTLIIGLFDNNYSENYLIKWQSENPKKIERGSNFLSGSGEEYYGKFAIPFIHDLISKPLLAVKKGAVLSFYLNQKLFHSLGKKLSRRGVGGLFFSMCLEGNRIIPQEDTVILKIDVVPNKNTFYIYAIKLAFRDGMLFVNSSINNQKKVLINTINCTKEITETIRKFGNRALEYLDYDLETIWDLAIAKNLEIHFNYDNIPSHYQSCEPNEELLKLDNTKKNVIVHKTIKKLIIDLINKAR